jgi:phosphoglycerate dehydrogenase-like enzyme
MCARQGSVVDQLMSTIARGIVDMTDESRDGAVVGVLYPREWYRNDDGFAREIADLRALDPRVSVVVETYVEPHDLRSARGKPSAASLRERAPALSDGQRVALAQIDIALAIDLPFDVATLAPRLRWVQAVGAGTGQLQSSGLAEAGIRLTTAAGTSAASMAEFVFARLLEDLKQLRQLDVAQAGHRWEPVYGQQLGGRTIGLIGLGAINQAVAVRARAFDLRVLATRRSATPGATAPDVDGLYAPSELTTMLGQCDIVVAAVPETPETVGLMDAAAFGAMRPGAFFCNVGRGSLVDEPALIDALRRGHLRGAALDVASIEPLPPDDALWDAPRLHLSAHCSTSPGALFTNLHALFRDNLVRYLDGRPLLNEVDLGRGY